MAGDGEMGRPSAAVLVVIDGLSDISHATSLSRAHTPHLDMLARGGRVGLIDPVRPGLACGSDTAHLSLFGYDPFACYRGRGAFEAMGAGVEMLAGDVAFKCNLAVVDAGGVVTTRCAGSGPEMDRVGRWVAKRLDGVRVAGFDDVEVHVKHAGFHRCVVRLRGPGLSDAVSDTDPLGDRRALRRARGKSRAGERTAAAVNATSARFREVLGAAAWAGGPRCNVVLFRGAAERIGVEPFDRRTACRAFLIAPCKIIRGVGETVGLDYVRPPGATGGFDTDLRSKARACVDMLMRRGGRGASWAYHLGVVHVKAVDEAAHEQDDAKKTRWIGRADVMVGDVVRLLRARQRTDVAVVVTGDHSSPVVCGDHTCEPVPIVVGGVGDGWIEPDEATTFDEVSAGTHGSLGRFGGGEVMRVVRALLGRDAVTPTRIL